MHAPWQSFREGLRVTLRSRHNLIQFNRLQALLPGDLDTPDRVIAFLAGREGDGRDRADVLRLLIDRVQAAGPDAGTAFALLALGRWRDLDVTYEFWRQAFRGDPEEIVARIRVAFANAVLAMDTARSSNPEASLRLSTKRPLRAWWKRLKRERGAERPEWIPGPDDEQSVQDASPAGLPRAMSPAARMAFLQEIARQAAGDDAEIVFAVDLCDEDLHDVAVRLGAGYESVRKRYQRAKTRIANAFREKGIGPCPGSAATHASTGCKGGGRPGGSR